MRRSTRLDGDRNYRSPFDPPPVPKSDLLTADERESVEMIRGDGKGGVEAHLLAIDRIAPKPRT